MDISFQNASANFKQTCKKCTTSFEITSADLEFYKKVKVPAPLFCFSCRLQRKLSFRNERKIYKRKCDATKKDIISTISPDKPYKVYDNAYWSSDAWDPCDFGINYDFSKSFFEQFRELLVKVPQPNLVSISNTNSDYASYCVDVTDCYFLCMSNASRNCHYGKLYFQCEDSIDCFDIKNSRGCYENIAGFNNTDCNYLLNSSDCFESHFSDNLKNSKHCVLSFNLNHKEFCIRNKQVTKEEYEYFMKNTSFEKLKEEFLELRKNQIYKYSKQVSSENCTGDSITHSKDCDYAFNVEGSQHAKYISGTVGISDSYDVFASAGNSTLIYDQIGSMASHKCAWNVASVRCEECYYCYMPTNCKNLFGCIGLRNKEYCILNKQYTQTEYESLVEKIKLQMQNSGIYGEFFPSELSIFGYNESTAFELFPQEKQNALSNNFVWSDYSPDAPYNGLWYEPKDITYYHEADHAKELLAGILQCKVTKRPFRITSQELAFYIKHSVPIPRKHMDQRYMERMMFLNPPELWSRSCMCTESMHSNHSGSACTIQFETTFAPERTEKIYCEQCFQNTFL